MCQAGPGRAGVWLRCAPLPVGLRRSSKPVRPGARGSVAVLQLGVEQQRLVRVVEDDDLPRSFLLRSLAADGFRVAGASGVGEGLRPIDVREPALVVLDRVLDNGSGLALLDRVRASDGLSSRIDPD